MAIDPAKFELAEGYLKTSRELATLRNFLGALESLSNAFASVKDHPEAILLQACVRAAQGRPELASKELERFARLYPAWISSGATLGGWLMRDRRQVMGGTQRRWFVLKDKFLFYYREPTDSFPLSGYVIENTAVAQEELGDSRAPTQFSFAIPPTINYILDAFDVKTRAEWITVLTEANLIDPFEPGHSYFLDAASVLNSATPSTTSKAPALLEGYLSKRGSTNTDWKLRWFSLRGTLLTYSEKDGSKPLGSIDVRNSKVRQGEDQDAAFPFQLITPIRTYFLDSEHADTTRAWIVAIFNAQEDAIKISTDSILTAALDNTYDPDEVRRKTHHGSTTSLKPINASPSSTPPSSSVLQSPEGPLSPETDSSPLAASNPLAVRKTLDPAMGRKWGSGTKKNLGESSNQESDVVEPLLSASPVQPYLGVTRNRTSALTPNSAHAVELTEFRAPETTRVALASLNEEEEIRRNRIARHSAGRARFDRSQSELLQEPLLELDEATDQPEETQTCLGCPIS